MAVPSGIPISPISGVVHRRARDLGLSLVQVADKASVSRSCLYKLFDGQTHDPSIQTLYRLAAAIDVAPMALFRLFAKRDVTRDAVGQAVVRATADPSDAIQFCGDATVPDHALVVPGERFTKTWTVQNVGSERWVDRILERVDDQYVVARRASNGSLSAVLDTHLMSLGHAIRISEVMPGHSVNVSMEFVAPQENCSVASIWRFVNINGRPIYPTNFFLQVMVTVVGH